MYDNLESLGNNPEEVEASLAEFELATSRLSRFQARQMLNHALDNTRIDDEERESFIEAVLSNNCVINGTFFWAIDGVILGCPLVLGYDLPDKDGDLWVERYPKWGAAAFYSVWDGLLSQLADRIMVDTHKRPDAFVLID